MVFPYEGNETVFENWARLICIMDKCEENNDQEERQNYVIAQRGLNSNEIVFIAKFVPEVEMALCYSMKDNASIINPHNDKKYLPLVLAELIKEECDEYEWNRAVDLMKSGKKLVLTAYGDGNDIYIVAIKDGDFVVVDIDKTHKGCIEESKEEPYTVVFAINGRFAVDVMAKNPSDAELKAFENYIFADFGSLSDIEYKLEHVEDKEGKYYYSEDLNNVKC